ncbi:MAG TPA: GNAT family N-acetyltransferase [Bacteroidota bacterium]|jgi:CelD/BcsL family acetyltransferase involved in cellulose biosynthesis|nr:GNAT family N-acetyltransferase [Bacteroidota bacterium]
MSVIINDGMKPPGSQQSTGVEDFTEEFTAVPMPGTHCAIRMVRTDSEFDSLEREWNELLTHSQASIFQTFEWLRTWWTYFGKKLRLHILVFFAGRRMVGIAPMFQQEVKTGGMKVATSLRFIGCGISDYMDIIIRRGFEQDVIEVFASYLQLTSGEWDVFEIVDLNERSPVLQRLPGLLLARGMNVYAYQGNVCPQVSLPDSWEGFLRHIGPKNRYHLKRKKEKLNENFRCEVEIYRDEKDDVPRAVDEFIRIHEHRWRSLGFPSAFDDESHRAFHVDVARRMARRGWLRLLFLKVNGQRVAVSFDFNFNKRIHVYLSHANGPDEIMKCSPGFLIRCLAIERGISENMNVYDFLRGNEAYKYEEFRCVASKNWLVMASSPSPFGKVRFWFFVTRELSVKSIDRLRREYYEFKRFLITKHPTARMIMQFLISKMSLLFSLGYNYIARFSLRSGRTLSQHANMTEGERSAQG